MPGRLVISLDFELHWGVRDVVTLDAYRENLRGVRDAIPAILKLFEEYGIRATWATVGFLFFGSKDELLAHLPARKPRYENSALSPYTALESVGSDEAVDPYHFGRALVDRIRAVDGQEIGSHTFSHYYALEAGQTDDTFRDDLQAAKRAAERLGIQLRSLVFPRNQWNPLYLDVCRDVGLTSYRGNQDSWLYRAQNGQGEIWRRGARLLDAYVNMSGHHTFRLSEVGLSGPPFNLPASRFLRPWSPKLDLLEEPRLRRIERGMSYAARTSEVFHLWWHPHNFGVNLTENLAVLRRLLIHFDRLRRRFGMESASMDDLASRLLESAAERRKVLA